MSDDHAPIACSLPEAAAADQLSAWRRLGQLCLATDGRAGRFRLIFESDALATVSAVAEIERECCPFLSIDLTSDQDQVVLTVSAERADAQSLVDLVLEAVESGSGSRH